MPLQVSTNETSSGNILMLLNTTTEQRATMSIPTSFASGTPLAPLAAGVYVAIAGGNAQISVGTKEYLPEILNERLRSSLPSLVRGPLNNFRDGIAKFHVETQRMISDLATPGPASPTQQAIWDRSVRQFDAASGPDRMRMVMEFGLEKLTGLYVAGCFDDLPADVARVALDLYLTQRFATRQGLAAKYPVIASAENPVSIGTDQDAVMAEAKAFVGALRNREKLVDQAINVCRDVVVWLAVALQCSTDEAFTIATGSIIGPKISASQRR